MEFVYKHLLGGYRPENEKNKATHVVMSLGELNRLEGQIRSLEAKIKEMDMQHKHELEKMEQKTMAFTKEIQAEATGSIEKAEDERNFAVAEVKRLKSLNQNLKRIAKERANAKRGIVPKKDHHGYIVLDQQQHDYILRYEEGRRIKTETLSGWKVRVQTPYDSSIPFDVIRKEIGADMSQEIAKILGFSTVRDVSEIEHDTFLKYWREACDGNFVFKSKYKANIRSGFWEAEYLVRFSVVIPENMTAI